MTELSSILKHLKELLSINKFNWWDVARQLTLIKEKNLWRQSRFKSWTSWIEDLGLQTNRHPEGYFKMIGAYRYYNDIASESQELRSIDHAQLSSDNVMIVKLIAKGDNQIGLRLLTDVSLGRYSRRHLRYIRQSVGNEWQSRRIIASVYVGEVVCLIEKSKPFFDKGRSAFYSRVSVSQNVVFDCVSVSNEEDRSLHGVIVQRPGQPVNMANIEEVMSYVDYLWVASESNEANQGLFGIIRFNLSSNELSIVRPPSETGKSNKKVKTVMSLI